MCFVTMLYWIQCVKVAFVCPAVWEVGWSWQCIRGTASVWSPSRWQEVWQRPLYHFGGYTTSYSVFQICSTLVKIYLILIGFWFEVRIEIYFSGNKTLKCPYAWNQMQKIYIFFAVNNNFFFCLFYRKCSMKMWFRLCERGLSTRRIFQKSRGLLPWHALTT